jgi:phosphate transport system substrate-binding protein
MNGTYQPLARPIFIYVSKKSAEKEFVKKFVEFYLENAPELVAEVGYIPLQEEVYEAAKERFNDRIIGTVFGNKKHVGVSMVDLLKMEK